MENEQIITQKMVDNFKERMRKPVLFGKNAGKKREPHAIVECAWAVFSGYPRPTRNRLAIKLLKLAGFRGIDISAMSVRNP